MVSAWLYLIDGLNEAVVLEFDIGWELVAFLQRHLGCSIVAGAMTA